ncbi:hypothetical protein G6011_05277 [Alternaria panax]|uniref:Uncharacterized protein n=1 Tax=Alternaria panax TaxID=48097 RepID=A0AAD4I848_9PLEO|nr:hypothetical protein G6011_05277 [Alternaria panax]
MATLILPIFTAPMPSTHEVNKRDANVEHRDSLPLLDSFRNVMKREPIIEAIPSEVTLDVEHKRGEVDIEVRAEDDIAEVEVAEELDERGITRHNGNGKRGITRPGGNGRRGITRTKGNGKRGITRTKGNGKRSLVARALEYLFD